MTQDIRYEPLYAPIEVSRCTGVQTATLREWTKRKGIIQPPTHDARTLLSFINLVESHVLVALRKTHLVPMQRIRKAVEWMKNHYGFEHPLAQLNVETDGYSLFVRELDIPINASRGGQLAFNDIVSRYLKRIDRDEKQIPLRFYPFIYDNSPKIIVMDPNISSGRPVIDGTRINTLMIYDRYMGGESLTELADDYELPLLTMEEALRCGMKLRAA